MQIPAIAEKHGLEYKRVWRVVVKLGLPIERHRRGGRDYDAEEVRQIEAHLVGRKVIPSVHEYMAKLLSAGDKVIQEGTNSCGDFIRSEAGYLVMTKRVDTFPVESTAIVHQHESGFFVGRWS